MCLDSSIHLQTGTSVELLNSNESQPILEKALGQLNVYETAEDISQRKSTLSSYTAPQKEDKSDLELTEQKVQENEEYLQKRQHIMGELLNTAVQKRRDQMKTQLENWIKNYLNWHNYMHLCNPNMYIFWNEYEIHNQVPEDLLLEFLSELDDQSQILYKNYTEQILGIIKTFQLQIEKHFNNNGYIKEECLEKTISHEYELISSTLKDASIRGIVESVFAKFLKILKPYNRQRSLNEAVITKTVRISLLKFYNEQMNQFVSNGPHNLVVLVCMHDKLVEESIQVYANVLAFSPGDPNNEWLQQKKELCENFQEALGAHKISNQKNIADFQFKTKEIISSCITIYTNKLNEICSRCPNGTKESILEKNHIEIKSEIYTTLEIRIKSEIGRNEPVEGYKSELRYHMNTYFQKINKANEEKFSKFKNGLTRSHKEHNDCFQGLQNVNPTSSDSDQTEKFNDLLSTSTKDYFQETNQSTLVLYFKNCTHFIMAMKSTDKNTILLNEFGESETQAFVGYCHQSKDFVYGNQATCMVQSWKLVDHLDISYKAADGMVFKDKYRRISFEFLLGFLIRKLKYAAERETGITFSSTIIIIPYWFSSTHRLKMQHGAQLAGLSEVYLVNEPSAAAFACIPYTTDGKLIVISGYGRELKAFEYTCSKTPSKIEMKGYTRLYIIKRTNRIFNVFNKNDIPASLLCSTNEYETMKLSIRKNLGKAIKNIQHNNGPLPIYISDCEAWTKIIKSVVNEFGQELIYPNALLFGGLDLSMDLTSIGESVDDFLTYTIVKRCTNKPHKADESFAGPGEPLPLQEDFKMTDSVEFCQTHDFDKEKRSILLLQVKNGEPKQKVSVTMEISNEGILSCRGYIPPEVDQSAGSTNVFLQISSPNLNDRDFADLASWLDELLPPTSPEQVKIVQAKNELLKKCVDMTEKIELGLLYIKSKLNKIIVLKRIAEAKRFAEHQNTLLDDLRGQIEILDKLNEKYTNYKSDMRECED